MVSERRLHIFTKGHKNLDSYIITSGRGENISECIITENQEEIPFYSELNAVISSLKHVVENKEGTIPDNPHIFIYTNVENKADVDAEKKNPQKEKYQEKWKEIESLKTKINGKVEIVHIPKKFDNKIGVLVDKMKERKEKEKQKRRPGK